MNVSAGEDRITVETSELIKELNFISASVLEMAELIFTNTNSGVWDSGYKNRFYSELYT